MDRTQSKFVKAFLAVIGPGPRPAPSRIPAPLASFRRDHLAGDRFDLFWFGSSSVTLAEHGEPTPPTWIKGRPFYVSPSPNLTDCWRDAGRIPALLENLDGKFSLLTVLPNGTLVAATDLLASGSIYHAQQGDFLYVSTHLGLLLGSLPRFPGFDQFELVSLLATRRSVTDGTVWQGVRRLKPATYMRIEPRREPAPQVTVNAYADPVVVLASATPPADSPESLAAEYSELLENSLRRERYDSDVAVLLSGGRDSQTIATSLRRSRLVDFQAITYGSTNSADVAGATRLARLLRLPHTLVPYESWHFGTYAAHNAALNGGQSGLQIGYHMPGFACASTRTKMVLVGHLGNRLGYDGVGVQQSVEQRLQSLSRFWGRPSDIVQRCYPSEYEQLVAVLRGRYEKRLSESIAAQTAASLGPGTAWHSLSFDLGESLLEVSYPFFNRPFLRFALGLPADLVRNCALYDLWRARAEREAAEVARRSSFPGSRDLVEAPDAAGQQPPDADQSAPSIFDWPARVRRSTPWMVDQLDRSCTDGRLKRVCLESLLAHLHGDGTFVPAILLGLAPCLAQGLLAASSLATGTETSPNAAGQ